jgi:hypothetical protein
MTIDGQSIRYADSSTPHRNALLLNPWPESSRNTAVPFTNGQFLRDRLPDSTPNIVDSGHFVLGGSLDDLRLASHRLVATPLTAAMERPALTSGLISPESAQGVELLPGGRQAGRCLVEVLEGRTQIGLGPFQHPDRTFLVGLRRQRVK